MNVTDRKRVAVLISGRGSNLPSLLGTDLGGDVVVIGSNKSDAAGLDIARDADIANFVVSHQDFESREAANVWLTAEPFTRAGLYASTSVQAFVNLWPQQAGFAP